MLCFFIHDSFALVNYVNYLHYPTTLLDMRAARVTVNPRRNRLEGNRTDSCLHQSRQLHIPNGNKNLFPQFGLVAVLLLEIETRP